MMSIKSELTFLFFVAFGEFFITFKIIFNLLKNPNYNSDSMEYLHKLVLKFYY